MTAESLPRENANANFFPELAMLTASFVKNIYPFPPPPPFLDVFFPFARDDFFEIAFFDFVVFAFFAIFVSLVYVVAIVLIPSPPGLEIHFEASHKEALIIFMPFPFAGY